MKGKAGFTAATLDADDAALARDWLARPDEWSTSQACELFQRGFAEWNGSRHAFAFMAGRIALSAIVEALGLGAGDEVIVPGYTCVVVANALRFAGVEPVYADIELDSYGLDASGIEAKLTGRTRAILLHHLYGLVCRDYEATLELARRRGLFVIEDCAHAAGASFRGRRVGTRGDAAFYSSEATKSFCTIQGGIAVTNDDRLGERLREIHARAPLPDPQRTERLLRSVVLRYRQLKHPQRRLLEPLALLRGRSALLPSTTAAELRGERPAHYGQRMPAPLAALGLNQLGKLDAYNRERRLAALRWSRWCRDRGYAPARVIDDSVPAFLRYPVRVETARKRDLRWVRRELGVNAARWFRSQLHPGPERVRGCPNAETAVARCINLPCLGLPPAAWEPLTRRAPRASPDPAPPPAP